MFNWAVVIPLCRHPKDGSSLWVERRTTVQQACTACLVNGGVQHLNKINIIHTLNYARKNRDKEEGKDMLGLPTWLAKLILLSGVPKRSPGTPKQSPEKLETLITSLFLSFDRWKKISAKNVLK